MEGGQSAPPHLTAFSPASPQQPTWEGCIWGGLPKGGVVEGKGTVVALLHRELGGGGQWKGGVLVQAGAAMGLSQGLVLSLSS